MLERDDPAATVPARATDTFQNRLASLGGGLLVDAIRRDEVGAARSLLARTAWSPDLESALELQLVLPPGWQVVVRDGSALLGQATVALGKADGSLERQAELAGLEADVARLERDGGTPPVGGRGGRDRGRDGSGCARSRQGRGSPCRGGPPGGRRSGTDGGPERRAPGPRGRLAAGLGDPERG